jgi:uncharacterized protein
MRYLGLVALLSIWANNPARAQESCKYGSENPFDEMAKDLSQAKSCKAAAAKMRECAWGSSADTQLAPIVIKKCERTFFSRLSPAAQKRYTDEMQLCAYEFAGQEGTMYMSAAALCQVDVAARFAADPVASGRNSLRASFDCDKAQTPLENAICSDIQIGHADVVLSRVYGGTLKNSDKEERSALIESEKQWLQSIPTKCGLSGTPFSQKSLNCVRDEFEVRFTMLDSCFEKISYCLQSYADDAKRPHNVPSAPSAPSQRASFDCEAPSSALEIVICADAELGQTDIELAQTYHDAGTVIVSVQNKDLIESERQWLRFVSRTCPLGTVGGIPSVLARSCVRTAFQTRIAQLQACPQKKVQERIPCLNDFHLLEKKSGTQ